MLAFTYSCQASDLRSAEPFQFIRTAMCFYTYILKTNFGTMERLPRASLYILICRWETENLLVVSAYDFFSLLEIPSTYILQAQKACSSPHY